MKKVSPNYLSDIEDLISAWKFTSDLERLEKLECDRHMLLIMLKLIQEPAFLKDDVEKMLGMSKKKAKTVVKRLLKCADDLAYFNKQRVALMWRPGGDWPQIYRGLPILLRNFAVHLSLGTKLFGPKQHPAHMAAKWVLVEYVKTTTKRFCDKEVSRLIAAVTNNKNYTYVNHGVWRREYARQFPTSRDSSISDLTPIPPPPFPKS